MMNKDIQYYVATALGYSDYDAFFTLLRNKSKFRYLQGSGIQNERDMLYTSYTLTSSIYPGALKVDMDPL
jgi:hypothetical protein